MSFIESVISKAKSNVKTIVLPETEDERTLKAASVVMDQKIAKIVLVGDKDDIINRAKSLGLNNLDNAQFINPHTSDMLDEFVKSYTAKRAKRGMTEEKAKEILTTEYIYFGAMLVDKGIADGMVAGAVNSTGNTLKSIIHCIGTKEGYTTISSFFAMVLPKKEFGEDGVLFYADSGVIPTPTEDQLVEIAEATAENFKIFLGKEPRVAFLSFSTKGSADTEETRKTASAFSKFKAKRPEIIADGELQFDAAVIPAINKSKAPGSPIEGKANVLIFPDLNAGNIAYKLTQRFAGAEAFGPLLQGAKKPVNDLSRGCSADDIVTVVAITAVEATGA